MLNIIIGCCLQVNAAWPSLPGQEQGIATKNGIAGMRKHETDTVDDALVPYLWYGTVNWCLLSG